MNDKYFRKELNKISKNILMDLSQIAVAKNRFVHIA